MHGRTEVFAVITDSGAVCLCRSDEADRYTFPGGEPQAGESLMDAIVRLVRDSTDMVVIGLPLELCHFVQYFYDLDTCSGWVSSRYFFSVRVTKTPDFFIGHKDASVFRLPLKRGEFPPMVRMVLDTYAPKNMKHPGNEPGGE
ncbi:NUDIX hydrolase [Nocardia rhizosphaerihabitans]|uniref:NUDIX hydrolase n=1 Tax=Nocardia rhizosphaerihabitans TaxID=1691570 RepID=UPI00366FB227